MVDLGILAYTQKDETTVQAGNVQYIYFDRAWYSTLTEATWPAWYKKYQRIWQSTYTEDPWGYYATPASHKKGMTNVNFVKWMFDLASNAKNGYDYGVFMGREELYSPIRLASGAWPAWTVKLNEWTIDGEIDLAGQHLEAMKPWYTRVYGAWDQTWWNSVSSTNNYNDAKVKAFAAEYFFKLHRAWVQHMKNMGKKSAIIAFQFAQPTFSNRLVEYYGSVECAEWVLTNYDFVMQYSYPTCWPSGGIVCESVMNHDRPIDTYINIPEIQYLRSKITNTFAWNLVTEWSGDGWWSGNKTLQFEEYKRVLPYVDVITALYKATFVGLIPMAPRLFEFCQATNSCPGSSPCPTPICDFKTEVV